MDKKNDSPVNEPSAPSQLTPQQKELLHALPSAVLVLDQKGIILMANEEAAALLGEPIAALENTPIDRFGLTYAQIRELAHVIKTEKRDARITNARAEDIYVCVGAHVLQETAFIIVSLEPRPQFEQVKTDKSFLTKVFDHYPAAVTVQNDAGICMLWNQKAKQLFEVPAQEVQGKRIYPFLPKELVPALKRMDEQTYARQNLDKEPQVLMYKTAQGAAQRVLAVAKVLLTGEDEKTPFVLTVYEDITLYHAKEQALQHSRALLEAILDNVPLALYTRDCDDNFTYINKQSFRVLGEAQTNEINKPHAYQNEEVADFHRQREQEILRGGKRCEFPEEVYVNALGEERLFHLIKVPLFNAGPKPLVLSIVDDITERRAQEKKLRQSNSFLSAIVQNAPIGLYVRDGNGRMLLRNKLCNEIFGTQEEAFDDYGALPHETTEQISAYASRERELIDNDQLLDIPVEEYVTSTGEKKLLHLIKVPIRGENPQESCVMTLVEDITHRKAQEHEVTETRNFLQTVIDQLPLSLSVKDAKGNYILWNKKSEEIFGATAQQVIGKPTFRTDLNQEQLEFLHETDRRVFESGKEQDIAQELVSSATGDTKIMHTVKTPVFNPDGTADCLLVVSEDVTAKTQLEKQIREAGDKNTLLVENAREGVVIVEDGQIFYANRAFCQLLGYADLSAIKGRPLVELAHADHQVFLKDKCDAVLTGADQAEVPIDIRFMRQDGSVAEVEFSAVVSKYLGRRIMLCFVRDVTVTNRTLRDMKTDRENFRAIFEKDITPALLLSHKGYIMVMNRAARDLCGFTEADKNFYRNVYLRPAFTLDARLKMKQGLPASMDYVLDFDRAARLFPKRIRKKGRQLLHVEMVPINKRDTREGTVEADYAVFFRPPVLASSVRPTPPQKAASQELIVLPNSEPYALCDEHFAIVSSNELFCSLCQLKEEELKGQPIARIFSADEQMIIEQDLQTLREEGALANREYTLMLGSGLETCAVRLTAVKQQDGKFLFVLRSLAFQQQIMRILQERSAQLSALLGATNGMVFSVTLDKGHFGAIEQSGPLLAACLGYEHLEVLGRPFAGLFYRKGHINPTAHATLETAQNQLKKEGRASFRLPIYRKDGSSFVAHVALAMLDFPGKETALVVLQNVTSQLDEISKVSKEAQELKSVRRALPGLYIKIDENGVVQEADSHLPYLPNDVFRTEVLHKALTDFWPEEAAARALFAAKEAVSMNVSSLVEFEWKPENKETRFFEATVSPIADRREAVLWVRDISAQREYDKHIHELYRIARDPELGMTEQVDKMLAFGKKIFRADIGLLLRFEENKNGKECMVLYTTANDFHLERHMIFKVEECLQDVLDGVPVLFPDLGNVNCVEQCIHRRKNFQSLVAAPLQVGSKVEGALCFASRDPQKSFCTGAEELLGLMARLLSLRIELRRTGKMLSETSRSFARTVQCSSTVSLLLDTEYHITAANEPLLHLTGWHLARLLGRDFFKELTRSEETSLQIFQDALEHADDTSFQITLELVRKDGMYKEQTFDVFLCKDDMGQVSGYALLGVS